MATTNVNASGESYDDLNLVNSNPQLNKSSYYRKMRYGFANAEKDYEKYNVSSQLLRGTMTFSKDKLQELDPSYTGFTHVFVLRMPLFMKYIAELNDRYEKGFYFDYGKTVTGESEEDVTQAMCRYHYKNLRAIFEMGCTSYDGTPNLTLDTSDINVGWSERNYAVPTKSQYDGNSFTLTCLETRGEPLRHGLEYVINSIFDANGKFTHMGGALRPTKDEPLELSMANYTFSFMIVQTDPSLLQIQNIDLWNNAFFTEAPRDNLNWTQGEIDIVQPRSVQFRGIYLPATNNGPILKKAYELVQRRALWYKRIEDLTEEDLRENEAADGSTT